jgi:hypothetical protein
VEGKCGAEPQLDGPVPKAASGTGVVPLQQLWGPGVQQMTISVQPAASVSISRSPNVADSNIGYAR